MCAFSTESALGGRNPPMMDEILRRRVKERRISLKIQGFALIYLR
jgi:hypothetical protein